MNDKARRKELLTEYKQNPPEAGVYRIVNNQNQKALLGSSANLASVTNKLKFAQSSNVPTVFDHRLAADVRQYGIQAFSMEVLEVLDIKPETTSAELQADLAALEALWREKLDPATLY